MSFDRDEEPRDAHDDALRAALVPPMGGALGVRRLPAIPFDADAGDDGAEPWAARWESVE